MTGAQLTKSLTIGDLLSLCPLSHLLWSEGQLEVPISHHMVGLSGNQPPYLGPPASSHLISIYKVTPHFGDLKGLRGSCIRNWGVRPNIITKDASLTPNAQEIARGFRSTMPGTRDEHQIHISIIFECYIRMCKCYIRTVSNDKLTAGVYLLCPWKHP